MCQSFQLFCDDFNYYNINWNQIDDYLKMNGLFQESKFIKNRMFNNLLIGFSLKF